MPLGEMVDIKMGALVTPSQQQLSIKVGPELKGRILNALGEPIDDGPKLRSKMTMPQWASSPDPMKRARIDESLHFGVKAIDGFLTCGKGQRMGIFAGSGVGKSTLMGMMVKILMLISMS